MGTQIKGTYEGQKQTILKHLGNDAEIKTDAPKDNNGLGRNFSPTDMVAGALGACVMTIISIICDRDEIDISGSHFEVTKEMSANPRRIGQLLVSIYLPEALTEAQRTKLEKAALTCPVHKSLHPDIEAPVNFNYTVK